MFPCSEREGDAARTATSIELRKGSVMSKLSGAGLIVVGVFLLAVGLVLRWDLIDWLIDAVGFLFLLGGAGVSIAGIVKLLFRGEARSSSF